MGMRLKIRVGKDLCAGMIAVGQIGQLHVDARVTVFFLKFIDERS